MNPYKLKESQPLHNPCYSKSSLLIPDLHTGYFKKKSKQHNCRKKYFSFIIQNYLQLLPQFQHRLNARKGSKWKMVYQQKGQILNKKNFIPDPEDWELFRHAAMAVGVSMCFLFVFIMELEMEGHFKKIKQSKKYFGWNSSTKRESRYREYFPAVFFKRFLNLKEKQLERKAWQG